MNNTVNMKSFLQYDIFKSFNGTYKNGLLKMVSATNYYPSRTGYIPLNSDTSGANNTLAWSSEFKLWRNDMYNNTLYGIVLGSGSTSATTNDTGLENPISSGLSFSSPITTKTPNETGESICCTFKTTVTNTSSNSITISEVGFFATISSMSFYSEQFSTTRYSGASNNSCYPFLLDRVVLDEPIVIPSGEAAVVEYNLTIDASSIM